MQKIATRIFIVSSITFGVLGLTMVLFVVDQANEGSTFGMVVSKLFMANIFIILTSFALSIAGKYLKK